MCSTGINANAGQPLRAALECDNTVAFERLLARNGPLAIGFFQIVCSVKIAFSCLHQPIPDTQRISRLGLMLFVLAVWTTSALSILPGLQL